MKLPFAAIIHLASLASTLASPVLDRENTVSVLSIRTESSPQERCATVCRICTNGPDVWDCCACGNCCVKP